MIKNTSTKAFSCFVTGTDTEVGKTLVSAALLQIFCKNANRVAAMKPIASGAEFWEGAWHNDDVDILAANVSVHLPQSLTTPYLFKTPVAPHIAAKLEDSIIDPSHILSSYRQVCMHSDVVVVEGVGGFRVPLTEQYDMADLAQNLNLPVILVVGLRLGCINHTLLTTEAIQRRSLTLVGWVANCIDPEMAHIKENIDTLKTQIEAPLIGTIPYLLKPSATDAASYIVGFFK